MIGLFILGALVLYLAFAVWIVKRQKTKRVRWIAITILVLIPTWDEIVGRAYFQYLCATDGGIKVYKTVELPAEYWDEQGRPDFKFVKQENVQLGLAGRYAMPLEGETISKLFRIEKDVSSIKDFKTGELLGMVVSFRYFGGWVVNNTGAHPAAVRCPRSTNELYTRFYQAIFRRIPTIEQ
jgi:hypothetical protein